MLESSMDYWWPLAKDSGLQTPNTRRLGLLDGVNLRDFMDNWPADPHEVFDSDACDIISGSAYPMFLRSDQMAAKHNWAHSCYVQSAEEVGPHARDITETAYMADLHTHSFYLRELIPTKPAFRAFDGRMPITTEVRTFVRDGKPDCMHPYWPVESVGKWVDRVISHREFCKKSGMEMPLLHPDRNVDLPRTWRHMMRRQHRILDTERGVLQELAGRLAGHMQRESHISYWSADLLLDTSGGWWLTDMACGIESYHWPGCKRAVSIDNFDEECEKLLHETKRRDAD